MPIEMDKHLYVYTCARMQANWNVGMDGCARGGGRVNVDVEYKSATMLPCLQRKRGVCANDKG